MPTKDARSGTRNPTNFRQFPNESIKPQQKQNATFSHAAQTSKQFSKLDCSLIKFSKLNCEFQREFRQSSDEFPTRPQCVNQANT